jgi:hypothetical protein
VPVSGGAACGEDRWVVTAELRDGIIELRSNWVDEGDCDDMATSVLLVIELEQDYATYPVTLYDDGAVPPLVLKG